MNSNRNQSSFRQSQFSNINKKQMRHPQNLFSEQSQNTITSLNSSYYGIFKQSQGKQSIKRNNGDQVYHDRIRQRLNHRSSSREKILQCKINIMLKQQSQKIQQINEQSKNKIKFNHSKNQTESHINKSKLLEVSNSDNKQNQMQYFNKQSAKPIQTNKSQKLTLRNYLNSTPQQFLIQQSKVSSQNQNKKSSNSQQQKNDKVLQEVRQIKTMFIRILKEKQEIKTERKQANLRKIQVRKQKELFTIP